MGCKQKCYVNFLEVSIKDRMDSSLALSSSCQLPCSHLEPWSLGMVKWQEKGLIMEPIMLILDYLPLNFINVKEK